MKSIISTIIVLMFLPAVSNAGIYGKIEAGVPIPYNTEYKINYHTDEMADYSDTYFTDMVLGYKGFILNTGIQYFLYGGIFTWSGISKDISGKPFETIYGLGGRLKWKGIYTEVNHYCAHPVTRSRQAFSSGGKIVSFYYVPDRRSFLQSMSHVLIGYEFEIK